MCMSLGKELTEISMKHQVNHGYMNSMGFSASRSDYFCDALFFYLLK